MPIDWNIQVFASVESTQDLVRHGFEQGAEEGLVVQAMQQTKGRGRSGHDWVSSMGNLYMSFLLQPNCALEKAGQLAFVMGVGLSRALKSYIDPQDYTRQLKWPNDVLINDKKISGILLEGGGNGNYIVGMGVNILNAPDGGVCLKDIAHCPVYVNKVRDHILDNISDAYHIWQENGFAPIREEWLSHVYGLNQPITARLPNETHEGVFEGIDENGALLLRQGNDVKVIHAADVHFGLMER